MKNSDKAKVVAALFLPFGSIYLAFKLYKYIKKELNDEKSDQISTNDHSSTSPE